MIQRLPRGSAVQDSGVKYARSDGIHIAYRVFGDGPRDMVLIPGTLSHVELFWEFPPNEYLLKRFTSFARVIVFDKRGQGLSDRVAEQTIEERIGDVRAVMDAAGSEKATIYGWSEGGPMSLLFAATYPERTSGLVLCGSFPSMKAYVSEEDGERFLKRLEEHWGEGILVPINAPSRAEDEVFLRYFGKLERATASPGAIVALFRANFEIDARPILSTIHLPTLILHRVGDKAVPVEQGRYLAQHIAGAKYVELPGEDHLLQAFDQDVLDRLIDEVEEFITGERHRPEPDRMLATVMFTDVVGSTEHATRLGDRQWHELLTGYYAAVRKELGAFRGREVNTAGDGLLATFDGPARAIRCACAIRDRVKTLGLRVRAGLHSGECELIGDGVGGIAVHIGARVASEASPDEVLVSSTVRDLVAGSGIKFADRGTHTLKGVSDAWRLFAVQQ
jgi:class 3 adenylate cyclase